jgi:hypothetical protein
MVIGVIVTTGAIVITAATICTDYADRLGSTGTRAIVPTAPAGRRIRMSDKKPSTLDRMGQPIISMRRAICLFPIGRPSPF